MKFYQLAKNNKYSSLEYASTVDWRTIICPKNPGHQRMGDRIGPIEAKLTGAVSRVFFWTIFSELIVAENFIELIRHEKLTGTETDLAYFQKNLSDIQFFELKVVGRAFAKNIRLINKCPHCGVEYYNEINQKEGSYLKYERLIVDSKTWDGSDFFKVVGAGNTIIITEKVRDLIVKNRYKGCVITDLENFEDILYSE